MNADEIAAQLNPGNVEAAAIKAARIMLAQIEECIDKKVSFGIETTLATRSYLQLVHKAQLQQYEVILLFFYLPSAEMAKQRVAQRVQKGGHSIPEEVIERTYSLGIKNLMEFTEIVDFWHIYENVETPPKTIAEGDRQGFKKIINLNLWKILNKK